MQSVTILIKKILLNTIYFYHKLFIKKQNSNTCIVFRSAALGDFIIASPALKLIRDLHPHSNIILITIQSASKIQQEKVKEYTGNIFSFPWLELLTPGIIDDSIILRNVNLRYLWKEIRPLVKELSPNICYILTDPASPAVGIAKKIFMFHFLGVRCPIYGWEDYSLTEKYNEVQYQQGCLKHHVLGCIQSVLENPDTFNMNIIKVQFPIQVPDEALKWAEDYWHSNNLNKDNVIVLSPGSVQEHKKWPLKNYEQLTRLILERYPGHLLITGTRGDEKLGNILEQLDKTRVHSLIGKTTIPQLCALLYKSDLLIGNDGGTMHLGDSIGCRVISIIPGLEYPNSIEPWHNIANSIRYPVLCAPCYNFTECPLKHNKCMNDLPIDMVIKHVDKLMSQIAHVQKGNLNERQFKIVRNGRKISFEEVI